MDGPTIVHRQLCVHGHGPCSAHLTRIIVEGFSFSMKCDDDENNDNDNNNDDDDDNDDKSGSF